MALGLRFRTTALTIGTVCDWFVPDADMPDSPNQRSPKVYQDELITPSGNTWLYDKGKVKTWKLTFTDITSLSKDFIEHISCGWIGSRQVTTVFWGSFVTGTVITCGSLESVGQCWGTGYAKLISGPDEVALDLWNIEILITQFGPSQQF